MPPSLPQTGGSGQKARSGRPFGRRSRAERPEIAAPARLGISLAGVEAILAGRELANHDVDRSAAYSRYELDSITAAERAGTQIVLEQIEIPAEKSGTPLIVEGAGGVMVPINSRHLMLDLMGHLALPAILAARTTLGTINHSLLSIKCLRSAGIQLVGVVLIGQENPENRKAIEYYGKIQVVGQIPMLETVNRDTLRAVYARHFTKEAFR